MIELELTKIGDALAVILPDNVSARLNVADGAKLYLADGPDGSYLLTSNNPTFADKMTKADDIISRFPNTLRILAQQA